MKIRITCTESERAKALECLETGFELLEISEFCPNRGNSKLGRVYVDVKFKGETLSCNKKTEDEEMTQEEGCELLREIGVPFLNEDTPLGIG